MLLHWRPRSFLDAVARAVPSTAGVLIQFPLYGAIASILTTAQSPEGASLSHHLSTMFVDISSGGSYPLMMGVYSSVLGFFVPSGGGKWIIEAPYVMQAANDLHVHLGWAVQIYNAAEALPNLITPFWMLPLLGILGLRPATSWASRLRSFLLTRRWYCSYCGPWQAPCSIRRLCCRSAMPCAAAGQRRGGLGGNAFAIKVANTRYLEGVVAKAVRVRSRRTGSKRITAVKHEPSPAAIAREN